MSANAACADLLQQMSQMMDLLGVDSFRAAAHARAARALEDLPQDITTMSKEQLQGVDGIGAKLAEKIAAFAATGKMPEHAELAAQVPAGVLQLLNIPGLGPKTVRAMWQTLNITSAEALSKAIDDGSLLTLPRMGAKAVEKIKAALVFMQSASNQRQWLGRAWQLMHGFVEVLKAHPSVDRVEVAGSLRRGKETAGDGDLLATLREGRESDAAAVSELFRKCSGVVEVLAAGDTKSSVRVSLDGDLGRWKSGDESAPAGASFQVDLRVVPRRSFGAALLYFTGSKEHNVRLRERAQKVGLTLNEWGLFPDEPGHAKPPQERGVQPVACATEEDVYRALKLPYIPPELREDRGELDLASTPTLIEVRDIRAELHAHTTASDGSLSIEQLAEAARARGFHTIAVTDHSRSSVLANGLSADRMLAHIEAVHAARAKVSGITILAGSEVDILVDGSLDYADDLLAKLDIVVASPHASLAQDPATATARLLKAIAHPLVHIVGHPTGRLINRRAGLSPDMPTLIAAAKQHDVALEINSHWMRLDLRDMHVRMAREAGVKIAINCDVHRPEEFGNIGFGVATARRGGLTPDQCINTWTAPALHAWLAKKR